MKIWKYHSHFYFVYKLWWYTPVFWLFYLFHVGQCWLCFRIQNSGILAGVILVSSHLLSIKQVVDSEWRHPAKKQKFSSTDVPQLNIQQNRKINLLDWKGIRPAYKVRKLAVWYHHLNNNNISFTVSIAIDAVVMRRKQET